MLTSLQNPLIKDLRKLQKAKYRHQIDRLLIEGTHAIEEAHRAHYPLETVCATEAWIDRHPILTSTLEFYADRFERVGEAALASIATTNSPDGIIATAPRSRNRPPVFSIEGVGLALDTLQDPGNLGTIVRSAVGSGASGLWLSQNCVDIDNPKVLRASAGAWFRLPMATGLDLTETIASAKAVGARIVATSTDAEVSYWDYDWRQPSLILLGSEGMGLRPELAALADVSVRIPIEPGIESLNAAIAASLLMFEARRQRG
ncbi:MAG: TrmH family RNA methyltransferase [Geitlerinemataceae cyanobacterium]